MLAVIKSNYSLLILLIQHNANVNDESSVDLFLSINIMIPKYFSSFMKIQLC